MDCPKCGTWNPDDKRVCWRCQAELPRPVEKKKRAPGLFMGLPTWSWVILIAMLLFWLLTQFMAPALIGR
ncbi:MAG: hypothetical protein ACP5UQ_09615 [Anaerolineae bacterium]